MLYIKKHHLHANQRKRCNKELIRRTWSQASCSQGNLENFVSLNYAPGNHLPLYLLLVPLLEPTQNFLPIRTVLQRGSSLNPLERCTHGVWTCPHPSLLGGLAVWFGQLYFAKWSSALAEVESSNGHQVSFGDDENVTVNVHLYKWTKNHGNVHVK